jgi:hypothetical protein
MIQDANRQRIEVVVCKLNRILGCEYELVDTEQVKIGEYLRAELSRVPLEKFIGLGDE